MLHQHRVVVGNRIVVCAQHRDVVIDARRLGGGHDNIDLPLADGAFTAYQQLRQGTGDVVASGRRAKRRVDAARIVELIVERSADFILKSREELYSKYPEAPKPEKPEIKGMSILDDMK